jgi:D-erythro-7,8-dihydroneopterin triphosphate epimerase
MEDSIFWEMESDMDKLFIVDLAVRCIIGVYPEERREKQDLIVNVEMQADLRDAGRSDDIADTIDYKSIKKQVLALIEESDFELIEALADRIAGLILQDSRIEQTTVRIDKPGALRFAQASAVEITRRRD